MKIMSLIAALGSICAAETDTSSGIKSSCSKDTISEPARFPIRYGYAKVADQWVLFPGLGLGYRAHGKFGFDLDFTAYTYWDGGYCLYGKTHGLYFPTGEHFYIGIGTGCIGGKFAHIFSEGSGSFIKPTIEGMIGYEWNIDKRPPLFFQIETGISSGKVSFYPVLSFGVGF